MAKNAKRATRVSARTIANDKPTRKERKSRDPLERTKTMDEAAMMAEPMAQPVVIEPMERKLPEVEVKPSRRIGCVRVVMETFGYPYILDGVRTENSQPETLYIVTGVGCEMDVCNKPAPGMKGFRAIRIWSIKDGDRDNMVKEVSLV